MFDFYEVSKTAQLIFNCSKPTIVTLEKGVNKQMLAGMELCTEDSNTYLHRLFYRSHKFVHRQSTEKMFVAIFHKATTKVKTGHNYNQYYHDCKV